MKILIKEEKGLSLLYLSLFGYFLLSKKINIYHRKLNNKTTLKAENYFKRYGLPQQIIDFFNLVFTTYRNRIGEETLGYLSLLYENPERVKNIQKILKEEKNIEAALFKKLKKHLLESLKIFEMTLKRHPSFISYLNQQTAKDIEKKKKVIKKIKKIIQQDLNFFGVSKSLSETIIITPFNHFPFQAASLVYLLKDSIIIVSSERFHHEIVEHEFLHAIINPLVKKIIKRNSLLVQKIKKYSSLYKKEFYKNNPTVILSETLIYSYINFKNNKPVTYKHFLKNLPFKNNNQFKKHLQDSTLFQKKCRMLKINNFKDFLKKSKEYYFLFIRDPLTEVFYNLYQCYFLQKTKNEKLIFSDWLIKNIRSFLKIKRGG